MVCIFINQLKIEQCLCNSWSCSYDDLVIQSTLFLTWNITMEEGPVPIPHPQVSVSVEVHTDGNLFSGNHDTNNSPGSASKIWNGIL